LSFAEGDKMIREVIEAVNDISPLDPYLHKKIHVCVLSNLLPWLFISMLVDKILMQIGSVHISLSMYYLHQ
jgi:hypothetical protein